VSGNSKQLLLGTSKANKIEEPVKSTDDFFALNVDFLKLNKQLNQPLLNPYFGNLTRLEIKGRKQEHDKIKIDGKVELVNKDINSLYQLLKGFENHSSF